MTGNASGGRKAGWVVLLAVALLLLAAGCGGGQQPAPSGEQPSGQQGSGEGQAQAPRTNEEIFLYDGADRADVILQGALQEGEINWYTTDNAATAEKEAALFQEKYPQIKVNVYRGTVDDVLSKIIAEARGGIHNFDVANGSVDNLMPLEEAGLVAEFTTPVAERLGRGLAHPSLERMRWAATEILLFAITYHTGLVQPGEVPEQMDYEDLADPRWKGRMAIDERDWVVYGTLARVLGQERAMRIIQGWEANDPVIRSGHALLSQTHAAGEFAITPTQYLHIAAREKAAGAQFDWRFASSGAIALPKAGYLAKNAPHPHAAMLFLEFMMGDELQRLHAEENRIPSVPGLAEIVPPEVYDNLIVVDAADLAANAEQYQQVWNRHILGR